MFDDGAGDGARDGARDGEDVLGRPRPVPAPAVPGRSGQPQRPAQPQWSAEGWAVPGVPMEPTAPAAPTLSPAVEALLSAFDATSRTTSLRDTALLCEQTHHELHTGRTIRLKDGRWLNAQGWCADPRSSG